MDDFSNTPFAHLKNLSSAKKKGDALSRFMVAGDSTASHPSAQSGNSAQKQSKRPAVQEQDEDAHLFYSAMQKVSPTGKKKPVTAGGDTLFLAVMERSGLMNKGQIRTERKQSPPEAAQSGENAAQQSFSVARAGKKRTASGKGGGKTPGSRTPTPVVSEEDSEEDFSALLTPESGNREQELFGKAMNGVMPLAVKGRDVPQKKPSLPTTAGGSSPAVVMQEILDGRIEFALHHTREYIEGSVKGVDPIIVTRLKAGALSPEAHIDLHGLNADQARVALSSFMKNAYQRNMRTVLVITGRGRNSPEGFAVLRNLISEWLTHEPFKRVVLAFCTARQTDGGLGALYVLLRKYKKSMGKIQWDVAVPGPSNM
jgi:Uncharacterized protein conserved in bacteria